MQILLVEDDLSLAEGLDSLVAVSAIQSFIWLQIL